LAVLIASSCRDRAALNIADKIQRHLQFIDSGMRFDGFPILRNGNLLLVTVESDSIYASGLDEIPGAESVIFASRHSSSSGQSTLTVHVPGNPLREARYGGEPESLAVADPLRMRAALIRLKSEVAERVVSYHVSLEATHHGPTEMDIPVTFVEIGSGPMQWEDPVAGDIVARAILDAAESTSTLRAAVGFGGGHYAPKFTDFVLEQNIGIGHIFPRYCTHELADTVVDLAFKRTEGTCTLAVIDRKGIQGADRERIISILSRLGVETCRA